MKSHNHAHVNWGKPCYDSTGTAASLARPEWTYKPISNWIMCKLQPH